MTGEGDGDSGAMGIAGRRGSGGVGLWEWQGGGEDRRAGMAGGYRPAK